MSPRVHSVRERFYGNIYDAADLQNLRSSDALFGNRNVGNRMLTNIQVAGQLAGDMTFVIANVYVRTNVCRSPLSEGTRSIIRDAFLEGRDEEATMIMVQEYRERSPLVKAFDEWAHACVLELIVGQKPMLNMNVYDLLGGPAFGSAFGPSSVPGDVKIDNGVTLPDDPFDDGGRLKIDRTRTREGEKEAPPIPWRRQLARPIIVPVRQNFQVRLESFAGLDALRGALPQERPPSPHLNSTAPMVWVHIEGLISRDVA